MVWTAWAFASVLFLAPSVAAAQVDLISPDTLHGLADIRLAAGDVGAAWVNGGSGKTGAIEDGRIDIPRAAVTWTPSLGFAVRGHVTVQYQPSAAPEVDLNEAYIDVRAPPSAAGHTSARAGMFYPPVSLEHTATAWSTPDMLSGSAINSWIGEEVLVAGVEGTVRRALGDHELTATAAVFGWNDTAGTLLSFRGWALHGLTSGLDTSWSLPALSPYMRVRQAPGTDPVLELDHRAGYYGRVEWRPPAPVSVSAIYYDNAGNRTAVDTELQWAWETRFFNLGVRWEPDAATIVLAQAMKGETLMGFRYEGTGPVWVDVGYRAAYVLARRQFGADALSGRLDWFQTTDRASLPPDDNTEDGWAVTGAYRHRVADHLDLIVEAQHLRSTRPARRYAGEASRQGETVLQTALRVSF